MKIEDCLMLRGTGLVLATMACLVSGCAGFAGLQDLHYASVNKARAEASWYKTTDREKRRCLSSHYESGYKSGFYDTATGRDCRVPAVPPPKYWATKYQCCEGQSCVQDWFRGYECGIAAAESNGFPGFHDVPVSSQAPVLNQTACGLCYSPDQCNCNAPPAPVQATCSDPLAGGIIGPVGIESYEGFSEQKN